MHKCWLWLFALCLLGAPFARASSSPSTVVTLENELVTLEQTQERLDLQLDWATYRYDLAVQICQDYFFVTPCVSKAKKQFLLEEKEIIQQENLLHARQRDVKKALKDLAETQREEERADPKKVAERANNRATYQEKQRLRVEREAELKERVKDNAKRSQQNRNTSPF